MTGTDDENQDDMGMVVEGSEKEEGGSALLPLDFFQGKDLQPGSECKVRIERILEGQAEVSYVPHESTEPSPGEEPIEPSDPEMTEYMG